MTTPNRLAREKSPYLLQHAHNPVDWYPWGEEAFARARAEDKPIFLSIGYSTCHWCHVMERESFEDVKVAAVMNERFVNVKVDREERPDVDRVYMAFVQATTGGGGWPMSVFLTPDLQPFFGGTYFPPDARYGRPGFVELCQKIDELWRDRRDEIRRSGAKIIAQMQQAELGAAAPRLLAPDVVDRCAAAFAQAFDRQHAGFGRAPKFPRPVVHNLLVRHHARTGDEASAQMVLATLHLMARGGMYDQLGGGFHRYSVDGAWHVPHFEKMLYDQAQLVVSLAEMVQIAGDPFLARIARETCDYVLRDLTDPEHGGFYSAEDADSLVPGTTHKAEGAFYVWTHDELVEVLGATDAEVACAFWGVEPEGNAEDPHGELSGKNVLHVMTTPEELAQRLGRPAEEIAGIIERARGALFERRAARPRPHLDDKVLTSWNGMMIGALARAGVALGEPRYLAAATRAATFAADRLVDADGRRVWRRYRDGEVAFEAYLDDYANLIAGLLDLYEAGFELRWLELAERLADDMVERFHDREGGGFYATSGKDPSVLLRLKDDYDGAEPAGNSVAAHALVRLAELLDRQDLRAVADGTVRCFSGRLEEAPHALPQLLVAYDLAREPAMQIVIAGEATAPDTQALLAVVRERFLPRAVVTLADAAARARLGGRLPWLAAMGPIDGRAAAYLCREHACERPVTEPEALRELLPTRSL